MTNHSSALMLVLKPYLSTTGLTAEGEQDRPELQGGPLTRYLANPAQQRLTCCTCTKKITPFHTIPLNARKLVSRIVARQNPRVSQLYRVSLRYREDDARAACLPGGKHRE